MKPRERITVLRKIEVTYPGKRDINLDAALVKTLAAHGWEVLYSLVDNYGTDVRIREFVKSRRCSGMPSYLPDDIRSEGKEKVWSRGWMWRRGWPQAKTKSVSVLGDKQVTVITNKGREFMSLREYRKREKEGTLP